MVVLILNMNLSWPQVLEGDKAGGVGGTGSSLAMAESQFPLTIKCKMVPCSSPQMTSLTCRVG